MPLRGPLPSTAQAAGASHGGGEGEVALLERVLERGNMLRALHRVERNGGAPGVDGMTVEELRPFLRAHWEQIRKDLLQLSLIHI